MSTLGIHAHVFQISSTRDWTSLAASADGHRPKVIAMLADSSLLLWREATIIYWSPGPDEVPNRPARM